MASWESSEENISRKREPATAPGPLGLNQRQKHGNVSPSTPLTPQNLTPENNAQKEKGNPTTSYSSTLNNILKVIVT